MEPQEMVSKDTLFELLYRNTKALTVALGYRDPMTRYHSERVGDLSRAIGLQVGLDDDELHILKISAAFHDIGKIGIPDRILAKPARLNEAEWEIMARHVEIGEEIIRASEFRGARQAALVIRHHHERFDGNGYPDGLTGKDIPVFSRIIAIADSYDAMAVRRSYHRARKHAAIMEIMSEETGSKFDPQLMEVFSTHIAQSPFRAGASQG